MSGFQITHDAAAKIARCHADAAEAIGAAGKDLPPVKVDGGAGTAYLMDILGKVTSDCAALARANNKAAAIMRAVGRDYYKTDDEANEAFQKLASSVDDAS